MLVMLFSSLLCEVRWLLLLLIKLSVWCSNSTQILVWISLFVFIVDFIICFFVDFIVFIVISLFAFLWISLFVFIVNFFICLYCDFFICLLWISSFVFIVYFCIVISLFVFFVDFFICIYCGCLYLSFLNCCISVFSNICLMLKLNTIFGVNFFICEHLF